MTDQKRQCSERVYRERDFTSPCKVPASVERNGKMYCKRHDPEVVKTKENKRRAKWEEEWLANKRRQDLQSARDKAVAGLTLEELQQITPNMIRSLLSPSAEDGDTLGYHWKDAENTRHTEVKHG